ncbi:MAG: RidA family protein [Longimicrobiales bacterium]
MSRALEFIQPAGWPRGAGYAHGVAANGRIVCTAGQIGWDPVTQQLVSDDFAEQAARALANIADVLSAGGAAPEHLVRLTWYITDRQAYIDARRAIGQAYGQLFGTHYPAVSVVFVATLLEPGALVEIEATAVVPE